MRPSNLVLANTSKFDPLLLSLLSKCTPHGFEQHITRAITKLPFIAANVDKHLYDKEMLNQIFIVGNSSSVFSCHMDIVGTVGKHNIEKNTVDTIFLMEEETKDLTKVGFYYGAKGLLDKDDSAIIKDYYGCPLGSDDKLGVYILLKMIEAKIPGMYIFHTGEECGGKGSGSLAAKHPNLFKDKQRAIAFDRANYGDVICFQRNSRCCSEEFGAAFATALNTSMPPQQRFKGEVHGTFTDTASYTKLIPECTNISVGYWDQHGSEEHFDYIWLRRFLLPAVLAIDYEKLPVKRDPKVVAYSNNYSSYNYNRNVVNFKDIKKTPWKDATPSTNYNEFPIWDYPLGFIPEANPKVLRTAISRYLGNISWGAKKDAFVNWLCASMEKQQLLQEENIALQITLNKLTGVYVEGAIEADSEVSNKIELLTKLVVMSQQAVLYGEYQKWFQNYVNGAKKLLEKEHPKPVKLNRIIYAIATLMDCSEIHPPDMELLLTEVDEYITSHCNEDGFVANTKMPVKKTKEVTYNPQQSTYFDYC